MCTFLPQAARNSRRCVSMTIFLISTLLAVALPAHSQPTGYWHTSGSKILDSANSPVRISGVNWYGFETTDGVVHGLSSQDYKSILATVHSLGYNTVRLPYANQIIEHPIVPGSVGFANNSGAINTDLKGLNSLQILDKIIAQAGVQGLKIILDNHRSEAGNSAEASGLWYTADYPESSWIADWKTLATRYSSYKDANGNPTLIGVDLRNEPHNSNSGGACWTGDSSANGCPTTNSTQNWPAAAARAGNAVLGINSKLLVFVEGTDCYSGDCDFWGGNLQGAKNYPVQFSVSQRLVYSAHDYGPTEYRQSWFNSGTSAQSLVAVWTKFWAYLSINGTAPVWVGEFGTTNDSASIESNAAGSQGQWFSTLINFMADQPAISWTYWALNGEDNYGLLDSSYDATPPSSLKQQLLSSIQAPAVTPPACGTIAPSPTNPTATAASSSTINLTWKAVTPPANCPVTYSVFRGTTSSFTPSSANKIVTGLSGTSYANSGLAPSTTYYYAIAAVDGKGTSAASAKVAATTPSAPVCGAAPGMPTGLSAVAGSSSTVAVKWTAVATPANCSVRYAVYRSTLSTFTPSSSNQIASGLSTASYADSGLNASVTYYYAVQALDAKGVSPFSAKAAVTTPKAPVGFACQITYTNQSQWDTGFQIALSIKNTGSTNLSSWSLKFSFPGNQQITSLWNANFTQSGKAVTLTNLSYNGSIAAGSTLTGMGFTASYSGTNAAPTAFTVNGVACH